MCVMSRQPSSNKGLEVYKEIPARKHNTRRTGPQLQKQPVNNRIPTYEEDNNNHVNKNERNIRVNSSNPRTYKDALINKQQYTVEPTQVIQDLLIKQSQKIDMLLQQISNLMGLMTKLVDKLIK